MSDELYRNADRRRDARSAAKFEVAFQSAADAAKAFKTFSVNISAGGLCIRSQKPHEVGESVRLELSVAGERFDLKGTVVWVRSSVVGIRFIDVSPSVRDRLERVRLQLESEGAPPA